MDFKYGVFLSTCIFMCFAREAIALARNYLLYVVIPFNDIKRQGRNLEKGK